MGGKIKILFLATGADDESRRRSEQEVREVRKRLRASKERDSFKLITRLAVRASDLQEHLLEHSPHIVHLSGRATEAGDILLSDGEEGGRPVSLQALAGLFTTLKDNIRVVVLNVPYADGLAQHLKRIIDFTVAMKGAVEGEAAVIFAAHLYQALGYGRTVSEGYELAVNQLMLEGKADDYGKPTLYVRGRVNRSRRLIPESAPEMVRPPSPVAVNDVQSEVSRSVHAPEEPQGASLLIVFIAIGLFTTLLLLAGILVFERTDLGHRVESYGYEVLQSSLPSFSPREEMPVVVVDVGGLGGGREGQPTPRAQLEEVVGAIARQNPRAIALNMDFSPNVDGGWHNNDDWEFLDFCLGLREKGVRVFAGVERRTESLPEDWLGDEHYKSLAAGMRFQAPNAHRVILWVKPDDSPEALPSISLALAESYRASLPEPPALLAPMLEKIEGYEHETERQNRSDFTYMKALVNYSILEAIEAASLAATSAATIEDNKWRFRDKLVIVGFIRGSEEKITVPVRGTATAVPGVLLQASATYTLARSPLFEFTRGARILLGLLPQLACVAVVGFLRYRKRGDARYDWRKKEWLAAVVTAGLVFVGGIMLVSYLGVMWFDFLIVVIALLLQPLINQKIGARLLRRRVGKGERATARGGEA